MLRRGICFLLFPLFCCCPELFAQANTQAFSVSVGFIENSQIFTSPQSPDPVERQQSTNLGGTLSYGCSYRVRLHSQVHLQLHGEYVRARSAARDRVGTLSENGYDIGLMELSGMFTLPFSTERFEMYVGGGAGGYYARRSFIVASVSAETVSSVPAFGIHILIGAEYMLTKNLGLRADVVFRDPQMSVENRFSQSSVQANGLIYALETEPFLSHVNLNGNMYALGLSWHF
jgi:hypothetical protein